MKQKISPNSLRNLKPFKPGQSGNPKGRPKGIGLSYEITRIRLADQESVIRLVKAMFSIRSTDLDERMAGPDVTALEESIYGIICRSKEGDVGAFKFLLEIMIGQIVDSTEPEFSESELRIIYRAREIFAEKAEEEPLKAITD